jgi:hypothetical protein
MVKMHGEKSPEAKSLGDAKQPRFDCGFQVALFFLIAESKAVVAIDLFSIAGTNAGPAVGR